MYHAGSIKQNVRIDASRITRADDAHFSTLHEERHAACWHVGKQVAPLGALHPHDVVVVTLLFVKILIIRLSQPASASLLTDMRKLLPRPTFQSQARHVRSENILTNEAVRT